MGLEEGPQQLAVIGGWEAWGWGGFQEGGELHCRGGVAVGEGLGSFGRGEDTVEDHAVVAVVGGVAVAVPVLWVQVELHVPADQARRFRIDKGVPEVRACLRAPSAGVEDLDQAPFRGAEILLAAGAFPP